MLHDTRETPVPWLLKTGLCLPEEELLTGGITARGGCRARGGCAGPILLRGCWGHVLLQLHLQHGHEPGHRPPKSFFGMIYLPLHLVSGLFVCCSGTPRFGAQPAPPILPAMPPSHSLLLSENVTAFPGYLHLLQMSSARDVQFYL